MNIDFTAIAPVIDKLAEKLGVAAEHLWGVMVRQAIADGFADIAWGVFFGLICYMSFRCFQKYDAIEKDAKAEYDNGEHVRSYSFLSSIVESCKTKSIIAGVLCAITLFLSALFIITGIKELCNPQYYAFTNIIMQFK
jgi:hypothetical protein